MIGPDYQRRFCLDFVRHTTAQLRKAADLAPPPSTGDVRWAGPPWHLDSLELVHVAGRFADAVGLRAFGLEDLLLARASADGWQGLVQTALDRGLDRWGFYTSGSQREPTLIVHSTADLIEEVRHLGAVLTSGPVERVRCLVPTHHIFGFLWGLLFPSLFSVPAVFPAPVAVTFEPGDLIVATPFLIQQWRLRGALPPEDSLTLVSTAPFPAELAAWLTDHGRPWLEIYGSTETGGIGFRTAADSPFRLLGTWEVDSEGGAPRLRRGTRSWDFPDEVSVRGREVLPIRRKDGAVQVGGVNVSPEGVRAFLAALPGVREAYVRPFSRAEGTRLKAWIVPEDGTDPQALQVLVRDRCLSGLSSAERPVHFTIDPNPPLTSTGKVRDW